MKHKDAEPDSGLEIDELTIDEELKYRTGSRFKWARNALNLSRQRFIDHDHFTQIFGVYSIYKLKEVENGNFGKRNARGELFKFLDGMSRFFNIPANYFIDPNLNKKAFEKAVHQGASNKYALFQAPAGQFPSPNDDPEKEQTPNKLSFPEKTARTDWADAPDVTVFYGRTPELDTLREWIIKDRCRLVSILGMQGIGKTRLSVRLCAGGIGKTDLSLKLARDIRGEFDCLIWRKLLNAPPLPELLDGLIRFFSDQTGTVLPDSTDGRISLLLQHFKSSRCLLILDNVESILESSESAGKFREGYEDYGQLFRRTGESPHQSCILLTSREKPAEIARMEGKNRPVRSLGLTGLNIEEGRRIFYEIGDFEATDDQWRTVIRRYNGNPLVMELAARHIDEVFDGNITDFLDHGTPVFEDLRDILDWHFERLNPGETEILYWLAVNRRPVSIADLKADILSLSAKEKTASTLHTLQRRMVLEKSASGRFTLQPVLMEYVTNRLITCACREISDGEIRLLNQYALIKALAEEYVRAGQIRVILDAVIARLISGFGSADALESRIRALLQKLRENPVSASGYAGGNLLNILCRVKDEVRDADFSGLAVRQAYLAGRTLHDVNFSGCDLSGSVFTQPFGDLPCVAFSPDGRFVAAGDTKGRIHLWETDTGQKFRTLSGHIRKVWAVAFSPDGRTLASAGTDELVRIWSVDEGACIRFLKGHSNMLNTVAFSPDGSRAASGGRDGTVRVWDIRTGESVAVLEHGDWVQAAAFSPDGRILASAVEQGTVRMWDARHFECLHAMEAHGASVNALAFSPDGKALATGSTDRTIRIWHPGNAEPVQILEGHEHMVTSLAFAPDGIRLVSSGRDRTVRVWDIREGRCLNIFHGGTELPQPPLSGSITGEPDNGRSDLPDGIPFNILHKEPDIVRAVSVCADGLRFASCGTRQNVCIRNLDTGKPVTVFQGYANRVEQLHYHAGGKQLAACCSDGAFRIWNLGDKTGFRLGSLNGDRPDVRTALFHPDGKHLLTFDRDRRIRTWHPASRQCIRSRPLPAGTIHSGVFSPDGRLFAYFGYTPQVILWDIRRGCPVSMVPADKQCIRSIGFSPDGRFLIVCGLDHRVTFLNVEDASPAAVLDGADIRTHSVAVSADGGMAAGFGYDSSILLWNMDDPARPRMLEGAEGWIQAADFSPDGSILAAAGDDSTVRLWDTRWGTVIHALNGHTHWIWALRFSPDGKTLVSAGEDLIIRLWDAATGDCTDKLVYPKPYQGMDITGAVGLSRAQHLALSELGAVGQ